MKVEWPGRVPQKGGVAIRDRSAHDALAHRGCQWKPFKASLFSVVTLWREISEIRRRDGV